MSTYGRCAINEKIQLGKHKPMYLAFTIILAKANWLIRHYFGI